MPDSLRTSIGSPGHRVWESTRLGSKGYRMDVAAHPLPRIPRPLRAVLAEQTQPLGPPQLFNKHTGALGCAKQSSKKFKDTPLFSSHENGVKRHLTQGHAGSGC